MLRPSFIPRDAKLYFVSVQLYFALLWSGWWWGPPRRRMVTDLLRRIMARGMRTNRKKNSTPCDMWAGGSVVYWSSGAFELPNFSRRKRVCPLSIPYRDDLASRQFRVFSGCPTRICLIRCKSEGYPFCDTPLISSSLDTNMSVQLERG